MTEKINFVVQTTDGREIKIVTDHDEPYALARDAATKGYLSVLERVGQPGSYQGEEPVAIMASSIIAIRIDKR